MDTKRCPVCKTTLFSDMDTCYGCMYRFGSRPDLEERDALEERSATVSPGDAAVPVVVAEPTPIELVFRIGQADKGLGASGPARMRFDVSVELAPHFRLVVTENENAARQEAACCER